MRPNPFPPSIPCHNCGLPYAGAVCHVCKEERPAYTALKNMSRKQEAEGQDVVTLAGQVC